MSGITLVRTLTTSNEVTIFDKSRGIGGRLATRRVDGYHFDHGAQFFTATSEEFKELCQKAKSDGIIEEWNCNFVEITENEIDKKWQFGNNKAHSFG